MPYYGGIPNTSLSRYLLCQGANLPLPDTLIPAAKLSVVSQFGAFRNPLAKLPKDPAFR